MTLKNISRQERKKEKTRQKIIDTAMALFTRNGFEITTMEQIAAEADVARRTLYNHFPEKEAILSEYVQRSTRGSGPAGLAMLQHLPDTRTRIIQMLTVLLDWAETHQDIFQVYFAYRMHKKFQLREEPSMRSGFYDFVAEIVKLGQQAGELRTDVSVEILSNHLEHVYAVVVIDLIRGIRGTLLRKSIEENVDLFLDGAKKKEGE